MTETTTQPRPDHDAAEARDRPPAGQRKREKRDVHGWLVLDKPVGMTSTHAVSVVKRLFQAKRAGHAGTLDPLASGLPADRARRGDQDRSLRDGRPQDLSLHGALGRGARHRRRRRPRGRERDARGRPRRHPRALPRFTGTIAQVPPRFSAVKIDGERAYDLAREGEVVELDARPVEIHRLELVEMPDPDHAVLAAECGKGTYVRALARDMGRVLGCLGHVVGAAAHRRRAFRRRPRGQPGPAAGRADKAVIADAAAAAAGRRRPAACRR